METKAWVIRAGAYGEREQWALEESVAGGGWPEVPDLTDCLTRENVHRVVTAAFPGAAPGVIDNHVEQLWALRNRVLPGDLLVMPLKTTRRFALGRATGGYRYLPGNEDLNRRHVIAVDWQRTDLQRTAIAQDLLFSLGSTLNIFTPSRHDAATRLEQLLSHGRDPGTVAGAKQPVRSGKAGRAPAPATVDEPELATDIEQLARDQIEARIGTDFIGHGLAVLVGAILSVDGFHCDPPQQGSDDSVDIIAGRGPLGLDRPRLLVQVKSAESVGMAALARLHDRMDTYGVDQGLLVAWGGLARPVRESLSNDHSPVRVWEPSDVVAAVLRTYDRWSDDMRTRLPLRRVWTLGANPR
ncbi:MAG TPA: restriction endonuclease [Pseudonocardia sp.]